MKILFFDFDGTIVDTKVVYYKAIGDSVKIFGHKKKDIDRAIDFGLSLRKTLRKLGLSWVAVLFMKKKIMKKVKKHSTEVKKCKDVESIKKLHYKKILITNSLKGFALPVLKHLKIKKYFSKIYGADDFDDKSEFLKDYIEKRKLKKENCFYIGDRVKDVEVAKKSGCKSIIISGKGSWDSPKELKKAKPDFLINDLADIKDVIEK